MGYPKALLPIRHEPAAIVLTQFLSRLGMKTYVSLPRFLLQDRLFCQKLSISGTEVLANRYDELGYSGSIKSVMAIAPQESPGIFILPVDTPLLSASLFYLMFNLVRMRFFEPQIVLPHYYHSSGHPIYFSSHFFGELQKLQKGPAALVNIYEKCVHRLWWPDARILANLNYPKDWNSYDL